MSSELVVIALAALVGLVVVAAALLRGWDGWLALKRAELERSPSARDESGGGMARIEMADLKERLRKLEAIAAGVDL